jgi:hypothetical protein
MSPPQRPASSRPAAGRAASRRAAARRARTGGGGEALARQGFVLTVVSGFNPGKEYFFEKAASIGRVESNEVVLVEPGVSRNHCRIEDDHGVFVLKDLGSANGTRLNGELCKDTEVLRDGDYITLGQITLQFSELNAARGEITARTSLSQAEAQLADQATKTESARLPRGLLATRRRKLIFALGLLLLALLVAGGLFLRKGGRMVIFDQSSSPLSYSDEDEFFNAVFGYGPYDKSHLTQVLFDFDYLGGRATLQYGAWGIDKMGELDILLNGEVVGKVPLTMRRWVYGLKLVLPRDKLKKNTSNRVGFRNTLNPSAKETWQICYVQMIQEAIPPPDPREARLQFELAKKAWEDREIEPANLSTALVGFKRARDLLEAAERTELYQETLDYIEKVDSALTRKFADGLFSARRAEKLDGDPKKARNLLLGTLRYFRKDDFRHREIQRYLDSLAEEQ